MRALEQSLVYELICRAVIGRSISCGHGPLNAFTHGTLKQKFIPTILLKRRFQFWLKSYYFYKFFIYLLATTFYESIIEFHINSIN